MAGECVLRLSWEGFAELCRALAARVAAEFEPDVVVGIARGGTLPGALIALLLRRDFQSIRVSPAAFAPELPSHLPDQAVVTGRRVLVVDEQPGDGTALASAVEALWREGAQEVRTLTLFAHGAGGGVHYAGPEVSVVALQPWIRDTFGL